MSVARIVTRNPESTENLAAYLRARGYEVVYGNPDTPELYRDDLTISVEACSSRTEALTRAHEIAAGRNCDVFVAEGVVDQLKLRQSDHTAGRRTAEPEVAAKSPDFYRPEVPDIVKGASIARPNLVRQILDAQALSSIGASIKRHVHTGSQQVRDHFRLAGTIAAEKWEELACWGKARATEFAKRQEQRQKVRNLARQQAWHVNTREMAKRRPATETKDRRYRRDWRILLVGSVVAALLLLFVGTLFKAHAPETGSSQQPSEATRSPSNSARTTLPADNARRPSIQTEALALSKPSEGRSVKVVGDQDSASAGKVVTPKTRHRSSDQSTDPEPEVTVRYFNRAAPRTAAKTSGVKHYSDLD